MWRELIEDVWQNHRGKVVGAAIGLFFGIIVITFDFVKALVLVFFIAVGYLIGKKIDQNEDMIGWLERFIGSRSR